MLAFFPFWQRSTTRIPYSCKPLNHGTLCARGRYYIYFIIIFSTVCVIRVLLTFSTFLSFYYFEKKKLRKNHKLPEIFISCLSPSLQQVFFHVADADFISRGNVLRCHQVQNKVRVRELDLSVGRARMIAGALQPVQGGSFIIQEFTTRILIGNTEAENSYISFIGFSQRWFTWARNPLNSSFYGEFFPRGNNSGIQETHKIVFHPIN